jgi:glycosyltransferase involved in cell wall biosynthesis
VPKEPDQQNYVFNQACGLKTVSVIIAAFRASAFINDAINSVLCQQLPAGYQLQFILGIDGCDATRQAVSSIEDQRIQVFNMDRNYGTYITFNTMVRFATGELIVRFDADDLMLEGYLRKQIEVFEHQSDVFLTWTKNRYIDLEGRDIPEIPDKETCNLEYWELRSPSNGQLMMRKELWSVLGGFKPWPCNSDTDFLIRMRFLGYKEHGILEVLYLRRIHSHSLTQAETTGYKSELRKGIKEIMNRERRERVSKEQCWVEPIVGGLIEDVVS